MRADMVLAGQNPIERAYNLSASTRVGLSGQRAMAAGQQWQWQRRQHWSGETEALRDDRAVRESLMGANEQQPRRQANWPAAAVVIGGEQLASSSNTSHGSTLPPPTSQFQPLERTLSLIAPLGPEWNASAHQASPGSRRNHRPATLLKQDGNGPQRRRQSRSGETAAGEPRLRGEESPFIMPAASADSVDPTGLPQRRAIHSMATPAENRRRPQQQRQRAPRGSTATSQRRPAPLEARAPSEQRTTQTTSNTITAHRMAEQGFRQAPPSQSGASSEPANSQPAGGESQWVPIVVTNYEHVNGRANRASKPVEAPPPPLPASQALADLNHGHGAVTQTAPSNQASSALLDFPTQSAPPGSVAGGGRQPKASRQWPSSGADQARPASVPSRPGGASEPALEAAGSHLHGRLQPHAPNYFNNDPHQHPRHHQRHLHHHHHHHYHHQHHSHHERRQRWRQQQQQLHDHHRRPRLNSQHEGGAFQPNGIEHDAMEFRPSKTYKRVLLCDKTLVSLDYVRGGGLEAEPRPAGTGQYLNELEINEINNNFVSDLHEGVHEVMARSATSEPALARSRNSSDTQQQATLLEAASAPQAQTERRHLLSDDDPLVRCDMWDLEKGLKSRKPPEGLLRMAVKADFDTVRGAINRCRQLSERTLPPDDEYRDGLEIMSTEDLMSLFSMKRGLMPGTKWCGLGDQASSYNDLGPKHRIDICCRAHDHCPIRSKPFRNDYGVLNIGLYTKSHCDCDADFYRCLRDVRSRTADMLGNLYFNVMKLQCMREERLKVCREMRPIALGFERCVRYEESPIKRVFKFTTPPVAY